MVEFTRIKDLTFNLNFQHDETEGQGEGEEIFENEQMIGEGTLGAPEVSLYIAIYVSPILPNCAHLSMLKPWGGCDKPLMQPTITILHNFPF